MKHKVLTYIKESLLLIVSAFLYSFGLYYFVFANEFTNGGVSGIVAMIDYLIGHDKYAGLINFAINIPLIIISFVMLSREFAVKTTIHIAIVSAFLALFPLLDTPQYSVFVEIAEGIEPYKDVGRGVLASLFGGVFAGLSLAAILSIRGSSGGADVIGAIITKKNPAFTVQWGIFAVNSTIIGISAIVYSYNPKDNSFAFGAETFQPIMLALIFQFVNAKVCDFVMQGAKTALKFEVITDYPEEVAEELMTELRHGVTLVQATGMFEKKNKGLLICVVKKRQIQEFKDILKKYPNTFAYVAPVSEIIGAFNVR